MIHRFSTYWRLFWQYRWLHLMRQLEYRGDALFWALVSTIWSIFNYFFFALLAQAGNGIAGWSVDHIFILLSVFTMLDAFTWSFFYHNMSNYTRMIFSGDLNYFLIKPIDLQFQVMTYSNSYSNIPRFFLGVGVMWTMLRKMGIDLTFQTTFFFMVMFVVSLITVYFLWFVLSTLAFWVERLDNINEIIPALRRLWQVPREVYVGTLSLILTVIFPFGLVASVPSEIVIGRTAWGWIGYLVVFALGTIAFSRWLLAVSIKRYTGIAN